MKHPNIIKIICHDIGRHLGCYGVKSINSNAIDTLAKNGILFKNSFATSPGCSPSRAAIATGMYPHNTGVLGLAHAHFGWSLDKKINHIAKYFSKNGYTSILFGLQHVTYHEKTLGFNKIFPERPADEVLKNITKIIDNKILKNLFMLKLISLNRIVLLIMEVLNQINLKVCIFQNIYQKIFIAEENLQKCKEQLKKWIIQFLK